MVPKSAAVAALHVYPLYREVRSGEERSNELRRHVYWISTSNADTSVRAEPY